MKPPGNTIDKIQHLPEPLLEEVDDFVDFLMVKHRLTAEPTKDYFQETIHLGESDVSDYLSQLMDYEERLARGEIQW